MALLEINGLHKHFGNTHILKGIDLSIERGEVLAMIGPSGGGKTTLLRCLNSLERPDAGTIRVAGETVFDSGDSTPVSAAEARRRQLKFGLVFQQFNLFPQYNVLDNIMLAPMLLAKESADYAVNKKDIRDRIEADARAMIERVGLTQKMELYPYQLSGGQQQRVAIARALVMRPEILCFDEPTSALDPELTGEVLNVIRSLADTDMTMFIVTHEMAFARDVADTVAFMSEGVIVEKGPARQVITDPKQERTRAFLGKF